MMRSGLTELVVVFRAYRLNFGSAQASMAATTTGMYSGLHPAMTALTAIFSMVAGALSGGMLATTSCADRADPAIMRSTRAPVGGMMGRPSIQPWSLANS